MMLLAQQAPQHRARIEPGVPATRASRNDERVAAAVVEPGHFDVLAAVGDGRGEAIREQDAHRFIDQFVGAGGHDILPSRRARCGSAPTSHMAPLELTTERQTRPPKISASITWRGARTP